MNCKICCKRERYSTMNKMELQHEIQELKEEIKQLKEKQENGHVTTIRGGVPPALVPISQIHGTMGWLTV